MSFLRSIKSVIGLCLAAAIFSGCSRSPRVSFYTLPVAAPEAAIHNRASKVVAVDPVGLPELVDRPQLVVRMDPNRVEILETHRWAESLKSAIPRLLAEDLARQLLPALVSAYPQNRSVEPDYHVLVDIQRFESIPGEAVIVDARWTIRGKTGVLKAGRSVKRESVGAGGYEALVAAHGRALAAVSADIAEALRAELLHQE